MSAPDRYCSRLGIAILIGLGFVAGQIGMLLVIKYSPHWQAAQACVRSQR